MGADAARVAVTGSTWCLLHSRVPERPHRAVRGQGCDRRWRMCVWKRVLSRTQSACLKSAWRFPLPGDSQSTPTACEGRGWNPFASRVHALVASIGHILQALSASRASPLPCTRNPAIPTPTSNVDRVRFQIPRPGSHPNPNTKAQMPKFQPSPSIRSRTIFASHISSITVQVSTSLPCSGATARRVSGWSLHTFGSRNRCVLCQASIGAIRQGLLSGSLPEV